MSVWRTTTRQNVVWTFVNLLLLAGIGYALLRRHFRPLSWWVFALLALPMVLDGSTHLLSDLAGIGNGFRDTNTWLASLTSTTLPRRSALAMRWEGSTPGRGLPLACCLVQALSGWCFRTLTTRCKRLLIHAALCSKQG